MPLGGLTERYRRRRGHDHDETNWLLVILIVVTVLRPYLPRRP